MLQSTRNTPTINHYLFDVCKHRIADSKMSQLSADLNSKICAYVEIRMNTSQVHEQLQRNGHNVHYSTVARHVSG
jgi:hypothetical protein